jgi:hypothetical protein
MSWTDFYPVFDDDQITDYELHATLSERAELEAWCAVARRVNERSASHRVAVSLFWKNLVAAEGELAVVSREQMSSSLYTSSDTALLVFGLRLQKR